MLTHTVLARSHERTQTAQRVARNITLSRTIARADVVLPTQPRDLPAPTVSLVSGFQADPYLDYGRFLTPEGGILMIYKDIDERLYHTLWRVLAWTTFTVAEGLWLHDRSPLQSPWGKAACFIAVAVINWLVVRAPVEIYRNIEVRPDCLIIEGREIFWRRFLENGLRFHPDKKGQQVLSGIYGTRFVEFLSVRRFDEFDRTPEIFSAHLQDAMKRLWSGLY